MPIALIFEQTGGPENLIFQDMALPEPRPGEVRYMVEAFALNRGDLFWLGGTYYMSPNLPARIGQEACGIVDAIGEGVTEFKIGDRVCSLVQEEGRYCVNGEFAVTPERFLVPWPENLPPEEACSLWSQALTAYYPFVELAKLMPGDTVLVTAGSSTSGNGAIQMAKLLGARVLATTRTADKANFVLGIGADSVIVTEGADVGEQMLAATDGHGVDAVFDTVAGAMVPGYLAGLARNASVYIVGALSGDFELAVPILPLVRTGATITGYSVFNSNRIDAQLARAKTFISDAIRRKRLRAVIDRVMPFGETIEAYKYLASGQQRGKVVIRL